MAQAARFVTFPRRIYLALAWKLNAMMALRPAIINCFCVAWTRMKNWGLSVWLWHLRGQTPHTLSPKTHHHIRWDEKGNLCYRKWLLLLLEHKRRFRWLHDGFQIRTICAGDQVWWGFLGIREEGSYFGSSWLVAWHVNFNMKFQNFNVWRHWVGKSQTLVMFDSLSCLVFVFLFFFAE